ncbi:MAG TPA: nucleotide exchange factor GrpE [Ignavibacteria bacterium]|nr:nucleotide exchange factor GrpE [Ignavibacteria bacterium]HRB01286.1 nucleotide exchange factor GrpE [Ignavibacteria bacterium]
MSNKTKHNIKIKDEENMNENEEAVTDIEDADTEKEEISINEISPEQEIARLKDTLLRKAAEFENYKRRTDTEISNYIKYASENLIKELLPVYDDLGRSVDSVNKGETKDFDTLKKGTALVYEKFKGVLEREGLTEINSVGNEFDVDLNSAMMMVPRDDVKPNTILEVIEKGYKLKDKVIRHEKVLVSSEPN